MSGFGCHDCGLAYGKPGWCDAHIPDETWARISPTGDEGGILCISCIARRLVEAGIDDVPLMIGSGPWANEVDGLYNEAWRKGRAVALDDAGAIFRRGAEVWAKEPVAHRARERNLWMYQQAANTLETWANDPTRMEGPLHLAREAGL